MSKVKVIVPVISIGDKKHKIFQIISGKDGSIYITFPYYKHTKGLVSIVKFPKGNRKKDNISLVDNGSKGKVTSHLIKVSHHVSGQTNISLSGKVFTIIKKTSLELKKDSGHLFTVQFQGLEDFEELKKVENAYIYKYFIVNDKNFDAFKIVGFWYTPAEFMKRLHDIDYKTLINGKYDSIKMTSSMGYNGMTYIIKSDTEATKNYWLCLYCVPLEKIDKNNYSVLTFLGGFDKPEIANNIDLDTYFIGMIYPAENYDELKERIGSIDIIENI